MKKVITLALVLLTISSSNIYAARVIGKPITKASCDKTGCNYEKLTPEQQAQYEMVISGPQGGGWRWTSREGKALVGTPSGAYIDYVNPEGAGSVKVETWFPENGKRTCEYFEHIHQGLNTITYWGVCEMEFNE